MKTCLREELAVAQILQARSGVGTRLWIGLRLVQVNRQSKEGLPSGSVVCPLPVPYLTTCKQGDAQLLCGLQHTPAAIASNVLSLAPCQPKVFLN